MKTMLTDDRNFDLLMLDKVYPIRLSMNALHLLEKRYGSLAEAVSAFFSGKPETCVEAVIEFVHVLARIDKRKIEKLLNVSRFDGILKSVKTAIENGLPPKEDGRYEGENHGDDSLDWDRLYFIGRYRLLMSDKEFWGCTPRRFWKLSDMWVKYNVGEPDSLDDYDKKEIFTGPMFGGGKKLRVVK